MTIEDGRVQDWSDDLAGSEQAAVRAEAATWSTWLVNSLDESDITTADLVEFFDVGRGVIHDGDAVEVARLSPLTAAASSSPIDFSGLCSTESHDLTTLAMVERRNWS